MKRQNIALLTAFLTAASAHAGKIVVDNDEWTLSNTGFSNAPDAADFILNVADWFTGGGPGSFLGYSSNFSLTGSTLASTLSGAGHTYLASTGVTFDLPTLLTYDGVFLAGNAADNSVLISYVNAGGNVLLLGGTGVGGAAAEEAQWDTFLNAFNLDFSSPYNGVGGNIAIISGHPIFDNVSALFQDNGNSVSEINPANPLTDVLVFQGSNGLYAVYNSSHTPVIPEPGTWAAGGIFGLLAMATLRARAKRQAVAAR